MFRIVLSSWLTVPLIIIKSPSLAPLVCFSLKFILSGIRSGHLLASWSHVPGILIQSSTLKWCLSLKLSFL